MEPQKCPFAHERAKSQLSLSMEPEAKVDVEVPVELPKDRSASAAVYSPQKGHLIPKTDANPFINVAKPRLEMELEVPLMIRKLITQRHYPCVAALQSFHREDYMVGLYKGFGRGDSASALRNDLLFFLQEQTKSQSTYLTFFAIFDDKAERNEDTFEKELWEEISSLTSEDLKTTDWPEGATTDPKNLEFCFHLGGHAFFVVGLHPESSRVSRRFPYPTLIFNVFSQFEELERTNQYEPMVKANRQRDMAFQGSVNPMVEQHGDKYEAIQFSGKVNDESWRCPFHFKNAEDAKVKSEAAMLEDRKSSEH